MSRDLVNRALSVLACLSWATVGSFYAQRADLIVQTGHITTVYEAIPSPDGRIIASVGGSSKIVLWDAKSGRELKSIGSHQGAISSIVFFPDGSMLASAGGSPYDPFIRIWDVATGDLLGDFAGHDDTIMSLAFSRNGSKLASASIDKSVKVWDTLTGKLLQTLTGHTDRVTAVAFSPEGTILASASWDKTIKFWNTETGELLATLTGHSEWLDSVQFSADGGLLFSGSWDRTVKIWDVAERRLLNTLDTGAPVYSIALSFDNTVIAAGLIDGSVALWSVSTGQVIKKSFLAHKGGTHTVAFVRGSNQLITGGEDQTVRRWDVETGSLLMEYKGSAVLAGKVLFSPDGKFFVSSGAQKTFRIWRVAEGIEVHDTMLHDEAINTLAFSPDSRYLAVGDLGGGVTVWDIRREIVVRKLKANGWSNAIAFSNNGGTLASGGLMKDIDLWDLKTGEKIRTLPAQVDYVRSITFSPDDKTLISSYDDGTIKLWNVVTGKVIRGLEGTHGSVAISPNGKLLASMVEGFAIRVFDLETGAISDLKGHLFYVSTLAFSADGKTLITGGADRSVIVWDLGTMQSIKKLTDPSDDAVASLSVPTLGRFFLTGSDGGKLKLWHLDHPNPLATILSLDEKRWVVVRPDGRFDTNRELDAIEGIHWVISDDPLTPKPLEIFMRDYYEPRLFQRLVNCTEAKSCDSEFKPLPPIASINRVQPKIGSPIVSVPHPDGTVDVSVEVGNTVEPLKTGETIKRVESGIFDLRLFVEGRLVASSVARSDVEDYVRSTTTLPMTRAEEQQRWRSLHDLTRQIKLENGKGTFVFRNVRLPRNGQAEMQVAAYAFNADRVKSETGRGKVRIEKPVDVPGKTFLLTIGVNASESPNYRLDFAANDARQMQEVLGRRLAETGHHLVRINLISEQDRNGRLTRNLATKKIIKGVFDLMAGRRDEVAPATLREIERVVRVPQVYPEDTVIITFSGHGYTRKGAFYMLPYDVGANTGPITEDVLPNLISSDELSIWMREIVAEETILVVDACHSAASVQGADFKPGPMGSRGLGQLAYDKGMLVLAAAQTNNVALELRSLRHGLLSYTLLQDGIVQGLADTGSPPDGKLTATEWLGYAVKGVPALYKNVIEGKAKIAIGGRSVDLSRLNATQRAERFCEGSRCNAGASVQQPALFDFTRRHNPLPLLRLADPVPARKRSTTKKAGLP